MDIIPSLQRGTLTVIGAPHAARDQTSLVIAELALRGPVTVLDSGNRFQPYRIAQLLRQRTLEVSTASKRIFVRRAFTCYQVLALLEGTPALAQPYLVLDLLAGFYDDHVPAHEARRILLSCLRELDRLRQHAPIAVTLAPPFVPERAFLIDQVCEHADQVLMPETPARMESQLALFPVH